MTTKPRELSVDRYNFYSTKETPLPDEKVAALHGMSPDELEDWKVKNGLTGAAAAPAEKKAPIKQVSIQDDTEELTVELYEQYKKADEPLSDGTICKKHGMTAAGMQKFKRENGLLGKFNAHKPGKAIEIKPEVDVFAKKPVPSAGADISKAFQEVGNSLKQAFFPAGEEVKPLREKEIAKERLAQTINSYQASKEEPAVGSLSVGEPSVQSVNSSSPSGWTVAPAGMQKVEVPESLELKWLKAELEEAKVVKKDHIEKVVAVRLATVEATHAAKLKKLLAELATQSEHIAFLENRHVEDTARMDELKKRPAELQKLIFEAEQKQRDAEVKLEKAQGKLARMDTIADRGIRKERLAKLLMEDLTEANQLLESFQDDEGVGFAWR